MDIRFKRSGVTLIVVIDGELDHHAAERVRTRLDMEIVSAGTKNMIFDLSKVRFMDSAGIGVIVGRQKNVSRLGGKTAVACMNPQTRRVLELTGFGKIIPFFDSVDQATQSM